MMMIDEMKRSVIRGTDEEIARETRQVWRSRALFAALDECLHVRASERMSASPKYRVSLPRS